MVKNLNYDKIKLIALLFIMIALPSIKLLSYALFLSHIINDSFLINQVYVLWAMIPFLLILYIYGLYKKKYHITKIDIYLFILILTAFISTIFSLDIHKSIIGEYHRNEGLLSMLSYYLIFLNGKTITNQKDQNIILNTFFILGIIQVIYAIFQIYTDFSFIKRYSISFLAMGLCGNPNFLGSYMVMLLLITTSLYVIDKRRKYLILSIIYFIGLILASSTGPFLTLIFSLIFLAIIYRHKISFKKLGLLILIFAILFPLINISSIYIQKKLFKVQVEAQYNIAREIVRTYKILFHIKDNGNDNTSYKNLGNNRIEIWYNLLPSVKKYCLLGSGLDTIKDIYPQNNDYIVDKAHNVYLQILITNGLIPLTIYLLLCLELFLRGFKLKDSISISLYMGFIAYQLQAFLNISVIDVAPYYYLILSLLLANYTKKEYN